MMSVRPFMGLWHAEIRRMLRDRRFLILALAMPIAFYLIFVNQQGTNAAARIDGTVWSAYFMASMAAFGALSTSVSAFSTRLAAERQNGWVRWLRTTPLTSWQYALAKVCTQLTMTLAVIVLVFLVGHFSQQVNLPLLRWLEVGLWLWIASLPFAALGLLIGMSGSAAQVLSTLAYLALSLLGGLWTPVSAMNSTMQAIAKWMPTYHFAHPAWDLLAGRAIEPSDVAMLLAYALIFMGIAAWVQRNGDDKST
ncbi:MAG: ABC transporter permease [Firmicutes bacterium]|nr:ABC transporter permease [Bacillota bacterium]